MWLWGDHVAANLDELQLDVMLYSCFLSHEYNTGRPKRGAGKRELQCLTISSASGSTSGLMAKPRPEFQDTQSMQLCSKLGLLCVIKCANSCSICSDNPRIILAAWSSWFYMKIMKSFFVAVRSMFYNPFSLEMSWVRLCTSSLSFLYHEPTINL